MELVFSLLIYPGLLLTLVLGAVLLRLAGAPLAGRFSPMALRGGDGFAALLSILLAGIGLGLAPWPLHPARSSALVGQMLLIWVTIESAFLVVLLPPILSRAPLSVRAAAREAQMGVAGRVVIWFALGALIVAGSAAIDLPGRLAGLLAGLAALPAAAGLGPFGPERSLAPAGAEAGLDEQVKPLLRFARLVRAAALLGVLIIVALPQTLVVGPAGLAVALVLFAAAGIALRRLRALPRLTLPAALRWCWWRALPLALAALAYVMVM